METICNKGNRPIVKYILKQLDIQQIYHLSERILNGSFNETEYSQLVATDYWKPNVYDS